MLDNYYVRFSIVYALLLLSMLFGFFVGIVYERHYPQTVIERTVYKVSDEERAAADELVAWLRTGRLVCANGPLVIPQYSSADNLHVMVIPHVPLQSIIEMRNHSMLSRTYVYGIGSANPYLWMPAVALARNYVEPTPLGWEDLSSVLRVDGKGNTITTFHVDATAPLPGKSSPILVRGE